MGDFLGDDPKTSPHRRRPYPKNAAGAFYVEDGGCISCGMPETEAPGLISHDQQPRYHCYFHRQPKASEEVDRAVKACVISCCRAVRYAGTDPAVLRRFVEFTRDTYFLDACDLFDGMTPSQRRGAYQKILKRLEAADDPLWDAELDGGLSTKPPAENRP